MKYTKHLYTLMLAIFIINHSMGQTETQRYIDVNGSAEMEITPDIIKLSIRLTEYEKDRRLVTMKDIEPGFLKAIDASGLDDDKVVVTQVSSNAYNTKRHRKAFASKTYELTFSDQKGLLAFTSRLKNIDVDYMYISKLSHTKLEEFRLEVKKNALIAGRRKAKVLVEAVDSQLGPVLTIREAANNLVSWDDRYKVSNMRMEASVADQGIAADDIGFKKIKLRYEINARFAIQ